jgi:hypothetical protein
MGEPKAFASLSSGLLARKGAARPAMRPQGFGGQSGAGLEDLGWDDMGFEPPKPAASPVRDDDHDAFGEELSEQPLRNPLSALTPIASPVHDQQAEIASRFAAQDEEGEDENGEYVDETAELYDPEAEDRTTRGTGTGRNHSAARRRAGPSQLAERPRRTRQQGQGSIHTAPRSVASPQAAARMCRDRPIGPAIGDRCAGPTAGRHARARLDGRTGAAQESLRHINKGEVP